MIFFSFPSKTNVSLTLQDFFNKDKTYMFSMRGLLNKLQAASSLGGGGGVITGDFSWDDKIF